MLLKIELDTPEVDEREPMGSALRKPIYVWMEHTTILTMQEARPGRFKVLLAQGMTFPAKGDVDLFAAEVNRAHRAYMPNPQELIDGAANDS